MIPPFRSPGPARPAADPDGKRSCSSRVRGVKAERFAIPAVHSGGPVRPLPRGAAAAWAPQAARHHPPGSQGSAGTNYADLWEPRFDDALYFRPTLPKHPSSGESNARCISAAPGTGNRSPMASPAYAHGSSHTPGSAQAPERHTAAAEALGPSNGTPAEIGPPRGRSR